VPKRDRFPDLTQSSDAIESTVKEEATVFEREHQFFKLGQRSEFRSEALNLLVDCEKIVVRFLQAIS
jgi:hypothetical protein